MWSLGCIIAEMFTGYPIFPGENEEEQLACIMEVMGLPEKHLVDKSSRRRVFFDSTGAPRPVVNSKGRRRRPGSKTLAQVLKTDDELFIDFIGKCLIWDPERRIKPDPALRHPWIMAARQRAPSPVVSSRNLKPFYGGGLSVSQPASTTSGGSPRKTLPITPTSMVGPVLRARTQSTHTSSSFTPRLSSKASLGLPTPSNRFSVKS
jgi:dual specificity tyrosine-phosphorylation-regulated kinase 2/3/4